jgi:hypothetical protein
MRARAMSSVAVGIVRVRPMGEYTCQNAETKLKAGILERIQLCVHFICECKDVIAAQPAGHAAVTRWRTWLCRPLLVDWPAQMMLHMIRCNSSHRGGLIVLAVPPLVEELGVGLQLAGLHLRRRRQGVTQCTSS